MIDISIWRVCGWLTTILFSACYVPQLWKTFKTKKVGDVSGTQWVLQLIGYGCGILFASNMREPILITGYSWGFLCNALFIIMYTKYNKR